MNKYLIVLKNFLNKIKSFLEKNQIVSFLLVFSFFFLIFNFVYMSINVLSSSDDHYFHFRFAEKLLNDGFFSSFRNFKSIYFTNITQGAHFIYYNFLFYLILLPFTLITPLFLAIKLYAVAVISLIGSIIYSFLKKMEIKHSFLWTLGFFSVIGLPSISRLFLSRPYVFAPVFILLLILAIYKKNYIWVFILSFLYLFWHTATFFIPILVGFIYLFIYLFYEKKYNWKLFLSIISGFFFSLIVVFIIDHGFFRSIYDNVLDLIRGIVLGNYVKIPEGEELYAKNFFDFLNQNIFLFILYVIACVSQVAIFLNERQLKLDKNIKERRIISMTLFMLSAVFFICISVLSNRFADFFIFFSWIFIVLVFNEMFNYIKYDNKLFKRSIKYGVIICLIYLLLNNCLQLNDNFASFGSRPDTFAETGNYISKNLEKGDIVFNLDWSWFPQLYYYAPEQNYVIGLEPKLTYVYNSRIYWLWQNISMGYACEREICKDEFLEQKIGFKNQTNFLIWSKKDGDKIANIIISDFKSHYIVSSKNYRALNEVLNNNKHFRKVFNDNDTYFIYKVLD